MFLKQLCDDPIVNMALEVFLRAIREELGVSLLSVSLYGSILFDDLAPGYGDLDFLAVVAADMDEPTCRRLNELRAVLRDGRYGIHCHMLEGAFVPVHMLAPAAQGKGLWWGTSGERPWETNNLGHFVLHTIREHGLVIWGADVRSRIPPIRRSDMLGELLAGCKAARDHATPTSVHCLDFLFTPARELLWLKEGRLSSKSEAADWGHRNAKGEWRHHLPRAKSVRLNPQDAASDAVQEWIRGLGPSILEATLELEQELKLAMQAEDPTSASG